MEVGEALSLLDGLALIGLEQVTCPLRESLIVIESSAMTVCAERLVPGLPQVRVRDLRTQDRHPHVTCGRIDSAQVAIRKEAERGYPNAKEVISSARGITSPEVRGRNKIRELDTIDLI